MRSYIDPYNSSKEIRKLLPDEIEQYESKIIIDSLNNYFAEKYKSLDSPESKYTFITHFRFDAYLHSRKAFENKNLLIKDYIEQFDSPLVKIQLSLYEKERQIQKSAYQLKEFTPDNFNDIFFHEVFDETVLVDLEELKIKLNDYYNKYDIDSYIQLKNSDIISEMLDFHISNFDVTEVLSEFYLEYHNPLYRVEKQKVSDLKDYLNQSKTILRLNPDFEKAKNDFLSNEDSIINTNNELLFTFNRLINGDLCPHLLINNCINITTVLSMVLSFKLRVLEGGLEISDDIFNTIIKPGDTYKIVLDKNNIEKPFSFIISTDENFEELIDISLPPPPSFDAYYYLKVIEFTFNKISFQLEEYLKNAVSTDTIFLYATKNIQIAKNLLSDLYIYRKKLKGNPGSDYFTDTKHFVVEALKVYLYRVIFKIQEVFSVFLKQPFETEWTLDQKCFHVDINLSPDLRLIHMWDISKEIKSLIDDFSKFKKDNQSIKGRKGFSFGKFLFDHYNNIATDINNVVDKIKFLYDTLDYWNKLSIQKKLLTIHDENGVRYDEPEIKFVLLPLLKSEIEKLEFQLKLSDYSNPTKNKSSGSNNTNNEDSIIQSVSFHLKDYNLKSDNLKNAFDKLIDRKYIRADKDSNEDQEAFFEIFKGEKNTKQIVWLTGPITLHYFIDTIIDTHDLLEVELKRWIVTCNCFKTIDGQFIPEKLGTFNHLPGKPHIDRLNEIVVLLK